MKKVNLMIVLAAAAMSFTACKKDQDTKPEPEFDPSEWADLGNSIFNDGIFVWGDSLLTGGDTTTSGGPGQNDSIFVVLKDSAKIK